MTVQPLSDVLKPLASPTLRHRVLLARLAARRATAGGRALPDFLVIGAMRAGTSSLYKYLERHPLVIPSLRKEVEYFTMNWGRGIAWYRSHFPIEARRAAARARGRHPQTFEATPYYLFHPRAAARAAEVVPAARIVVLLRDPIERAFSHYRHMARLGFEDLSFAEALEREPERLAGEAERIMDDPLYVSKVHHRFSYVARGLYAEQLEEWFRHFPRERFLILGSERFYADPAVVYGEILDHAGLPRWTPRGFRNYSAQPGAAPAAIDPAIRRTLAERFAPHNERLRALLGTDPGWGY